MKQINAIADHTAVLTLNNDSLLQLTSQCHHISYL